MVDFTPDDSRRIQNIAHSVIRAYPHHSITFDDLYQEGVIGFLEAKNRYDVKKNDYFWGFAFIRVKGSMIDYVRKTFRRVKHEQYNNKDNLISEHTQFSELNHDYQLNAENLITNFIDGVNKLTHLEQRLVYEYFINKIPIYKLAKTYKIKRKRVSMLISSTVSHIKEHLGELS